MKPSITQNPKFKTWLETQKVNPECDYEVTSYNRLNALKKSKDNSFTAALIILIAIFATLFVVIIF